MAKRFDLVVFDWDGTLMDSTAVIVASLQAACADAGLPVPSDERAQHIIGLGLYDAMAHVLPGVDPAVYPQVVERYGHHFRLRESQTPMFAGAEQTLRELNDAGHRVAIATGKSRRALERVLEKTTPTQTLMIGDTTHDLQMAINAGVESVAVSYGAHPRDQLVALQPLACMDRPQDLWQWLKHHA